MNWQDEGFLLSKIKFRENANIINVFTNTHGKVSGIVYGGNSRKIRMVQFSYSNSAWSPSYDDSSFVYICGARE